MPNRNNARILEHVLARLAANTTYPNVELIVVDDGSTDASRDILRRWQDSGRFSGEVRLLEQEHRGVVEALNSGLKAATGQLVVQLDADASVETPGWLEQMSGFFVTDPRIGVVTAKIVFDWGELHTCGVDMLGPDGFHDRGAQITEPIGRRSYHQRVLRRREGECPTCEIAAEVDGGIGCCMMFEREVALEVGGYDPAYSPVWFDDLDLTIAIRRHNRKVFFLPEIRVIHHVGRRIMGEPAAKRAVTRVRKRLGATLPPMTRRRISQALGIDRPPREQWQRLQHHYAYWRQKWGFDMLNPDQDELRSRWGHTEIAWRLNPHMQAAGEEIVAVHRTALSRAGAGEMR
jgi:glycosyltransferase involved in cell wall biosynthesis